MKKLLLLLSLILVSCSGGISEKSLFGEWVSQEGKITINEDNMNIDGSQYKYSINDINQDLGIIKLTILGSDGESFDADFVIKDEDNIQIIFKLLLDHITHTLYLSEERCSGIKMKDMGIKRKSIILDKNPKFENKRKCCN